MEINDETLEKYYSMNEKDKKSIKSQVDNGEGNISNNQREDILNWNGKFTTKTVRNIKDKTKKTDKTKKQIKEIKQIKQRKYKNRCTLTRVIISV